MPVASETLATGLAPLTPAQLADCLHCGTSFRPSSHRPNFCCAGCQFVHDLIAQNGLERFYDLQDGNPQPAKAIVFQKRDYSWLQELTTKAEGPFVASLDLEIQGLSCIGCTWLIERLFSRMPGALDIRVDPGSGKVTLRWTPGVFCPVEFARELQRFGYLLGPTGGRTDAGDRSLTIRLGICGALTMNTMLFTLPSYLGMAADFPFRDLFQRLVFLFGTLSFIIGGSYFIVRSWRSASQGILHIDLPISLGLLAAYAGSVYASWRGAEDLLYFDFVSTFTFLMLVGRWLQQKAVARNRKQLLSAQSEPDPVVDAATGERLPVGNLAPGRSFIVDAGQTVPVRSRLVSPAANLNLEWITGESDASTAREGRIIPAGATNCGERPIELAALESWNESLLANLLRVTPSTSGRNLALERFLRWYIYVVIAVAFVAFVAWWLATGNGLAALQVLISVLVVSCPCASGVALPLCTDVAASRLRRAGVFVRDGELWAKLQRVRKVVFDKTGTLTPKSISLQNPGRLRELSDLERRVLLTMVHDNPHPVSGCLREELLADAVARLESPHSPQEAVGQGLEFRHGDSHFRLGRPDWIALSDADPAASERSSDCAFSRDGQILATFSFGEEARDDASEELSALRSRGCEIYILSGDRQEKVHAMAERLGIPHGNCLGELTPHEKAEWIEGHGGRETLYIGDGANDSLAFDAAACTGTPAVDRGHLAEKAGFYFLGHGLSGVRALLEIAGQRRLAARQVVGFAIGYNAIAISLCVGGWMTPLLAAVLMPASSLVSLAIVFFAFRSRKPIHA